MRARSTKTTGRPGAGKISGGEKAETVLGLGREFDRKLLLETVGLPRSTFYYHAGRESADRYADVRPSIREIYGRTRNGMGYRQVRNALRKEQGLRISRKTVRKLMREEGLLCRIRRPHYNSYKGETGRVAGNLLNRDFAADGPFEKLVTDVTEFVLPGCKAYLSPVMDLYNNEIVSWSVSKSQHMKTIDEMMDGLYEKLPEGQAPFSTPTKDGSTSRSPIRGGSRSTASRSPCPARQRASTTPAWRASSGT